MEITRIDMSINTSSTTLQHTDHVELDREEMDRMTMQCCSSLSGFPYDRIAFRRYRHFVLCKMEDLSGIFSTPGAQDSLTIQGQVHCRNNTIQEVQAGNADLYFYGLFFNKKITMTRVSSSIESVTINKGLAAGIRNGRM